MQPQIFTTNRPGPGRLSTMARPSGGALLAGELTALAGTGVEVLVSLLTDEELAELGLVDEAEAARAAGLELIRMPVPDLTVPEVAPMLELARSLAARLTVGAQVVVHCRAGIGRSSMVAASVLVCEGVDVEEAWRLVARARGRAVPDTEEQRAFVVELAAAHVAPS